MSIEKRTYELRERAARQAETRRRIAAATAELHEEVGPARTTVAEIARRAGVQRLTVYNNFPAERDLFAACQAHFLAENPPPDPTPALGIADPVDRLEVVLAALYVWYRANQGMAGNVRRDRELLPALDALLADTLDAGTARLARALAAGFPADDEEGRRLTTAAVALALDFWTWRRLSREGLEDADASRFMARVVVSAVAAGGGA